MTLYNFEDFFKEEFGWLTLFAIKISPYILLLMLIALLKYIAGWEIVGIYFYIVLLLYGFIRAEQISRDEEEVW